MVGTHTQTRCVGHHVHSSDTSERRKPQQGCCSPREKKATLAGSVDVIPKRGWAEVEAEAELEVDEIVPGSLHCETGTPKNGVEEKPVLSGRDDRLRERGEEPHTHAGVRAAVRTRPEGGVKPPLERRHMTAPRYQGSVWVHAGRGGNHERS
jgi:hypothetical protein